MIFFLPYSSFRFHHLLFSFIEKLSSFTIFYRICNRSQLKTSFQGYNKYKGIQILLKVSLYGLLAVASQFSFLIYVPFLKQLRDTYDAYSVTLLHTFPFEWLQTDKENIGFSFSCFITNWIINFLPKEYINLKAFICTMISAINAFWNDCHISRSHPIYFKVHCDLMKSKRIVVRLIVVSVEFPWEIARKIEHSASEWE